MLKLKLQSFGHLMRGANSLEKDPDAGKDWGQEKKGVTEDEMIGWHHWLNGYEFLKTLGVGDGQEGLACFSSWGGKESDTTEWLNWTELNWTIKQGLMVTSGSEVKESARHYRRCELHPWVRKIPWRRKWQPIAIFLPGKSHGQRSLVGYNPWSHEELNMT